jgi:hypothetical protein
MESPSKTKVRAFKDNEPFRMNTVINKAIIEQVRCFKYLWFNLGVIKNNKWQAT